MYKEDIDVFRTLQDHVLKEIKDKGWSFVDDETLNATAQYASQDHIRVREDVLETITGYNGLAREDNGDYDGVFFTEARYKLDFAKKEYDKTR